MELNDRRKRKASDTSTYDGTAEAAELSSTSVVVPGVFDSWSRVAATKRAQTKSSNNNVSNAALTSSSTHGRGVLSGWTKCPLCEGYSNKKHALGRGLANHLRDIHTPWKPSKLAQKIYRRRQEALQRQLKCQRQEEIEPIKELAARIVVDKKNSCPFQPLVEWEPTDEEVGQWNTKMLQILQRVEHAASSSDPTDVSSSPNEKRTGKERKATNNCPSLHSKNVAVIFSKNEDEPRLSYRDSLPPFLKAAAEGDLANLQAMVEQTLGKEEIVESSNDNNFSTVKALLETKDRHNSTAEHWAAGGGHLECLQYIYQLRWNLNRTFVKGKNQDVHPLKEKRKEKLRRRDGKTCLHYAARNGHIHCIRFLLKETNQRHSVDERSGDGTTPLHLACYGGHFETARYLIEEQGANVRVKNDWGCSCAHWVAMTLSKSDSDVRRLCTYLSVKHGVSFVEVQGQGHTALHKAAHRGNQHVIRWMGEPRDKGGAGLSASDKDQAGAPDQGGHKPSDIWRGMIGDDEFTAWMTKEMGW